MASLKRIMIQDFIESWPLSKTISPTQAPWKITANAENFIRVAQARLDSGFQFKNDIAIHETATIEAGAVIKGPAIIGPDCFIAAGAYLRGGIYLEQACIIGPYSELKTTFILAGSKLAHLNFVGDCIIGADVNIEAGAIIANYRNEFEDKSIRIWFDRAIIETGVEKFGAIVGDGVRIGANTVVAPGAVLPMGSKIGRQELVDQYPKLDMIS